VRILLTGAAGFVGSAVAERLLAEGHEVHGLDDLSTGTVAALAGARRSKAFSFARFDVTDALLPDLVARARPEVICHLVRSPSPVTTVAAAVRVLEAAHGVRKLVVGGDAAVYGRPARVPVGERAGLAPRTPQAAAAASVETFVAAYGRSGGPDWTVLALSTVTGPGAAERLLAAAETHAALDLVHVDDVAEAFVRALGERGSRRRLNVGGGVLTASTRVREWLDRPGPVGLEPGIALEIGGIRRALGWEPFTPPESGLR
jgi:UDP-glucose 4-epimerase